MNYLVVVTFLAVLNVVRVHSDSQEGKPLRILSKCMAAGGIDREILRNFVDGEWNESTSNNNRRIKCFAKCILTGLNVMDGGILVEGEMRSLLAHYFGDKTTNRMINKCRDRVSEDRCETAFNFVKCIRGVYEKRKEQNAVFE